MTRQAITTIALLAGIFALQADNQADAGRFDLNKVVRVARQVERAVQPPSNGGGKFVTLPVPPPTTHPGHQPPVNQPPVNQPPVNQPPVYQPQPPVNQPPHQEYCIKISNHAGAVVYYNFNNQGYTQIACHGCRTHHGHSCHAPTIEYHNGHEVVRYELDRHGRYEFKWSNGVLQLFAI